MSYREANGMTVQIWGVPVTQYMESTQIWPLNPDGEVLLGPKIESKR